MLDFGLGELLLLGAVALIVLGPEKLPHAARMAGAWYGRIRRTLANVQAEIANEVHLAEMRQKMNDELSKIREANSNLVNEMRAIDQSSKKNNLEQNMENHTDQNDQTSDTHTAIMSQNTDWSHGIEAPIKSYTHGYYFFFVPSSMYASLIPAAPRLPKSIIVQSQRVIQKSIDTPHQTESPIHAAPL
ncbi:MAG: twin-arginine translocase subunit TatB [Gammaproteobacteria bacterium]|nr:twin-arginine translocase subunit TatB [Gammaproteobacteria bacterium]